MELTLLARIQKLLSKTTEAGCTEAEAATAFAMASRLMAEHGLELAEVLAHNPDSILYEEFDAAVAHRRDYLYDAAALIVERYFGVRTTVLRSTGRVRYVLFGTPTECQAALFVLGRIVDCCQAGWERFRARFGSQVSIRKSYVCGFMVGVEQRIASQREALESSLPGSRRALARVRSALDGAFDAAYGPPTAGKAGTLAPIEGDAEAALAGQADGRQAAINREIDA